MADASIKYKLTHGTKKIPKAFSIVQDGKAVGYLRQMRAPWGWRLETFNPARKEFSSSLVLIKQVTEAWLSGRPLYTYKTIKGSGGRKSIIYQNGIYVGIIRHDPRKGSFIELTGKPSVLVSSISEAKAKIEAGI